jgi:preprotein translocase subunit SecG
MQQLVLVIHVLAAICLIALILLQRGKGADVGAAFGSGASNTMFGSIGTLPFLVKVTAVLAAVFFITSISLGYITAKEARNINSVSLPISGIEQSVPQQNTQK